MGRDSATWWCYGKMFLLMMPAGSSFQRTSGFRVRVRIGISWGEAGKEVWFIPGHVFSAFVHILLIWVFRALDSEVSGIPSQIYGLEGPGEDIWGDSQFIWVLGWFPDPCPTPTSVLFREGISLSSPQTKHAVLFGAIQMALIFQRADFL